MNTYISIIRPVPVFWIRKKLKHIPKPSQNGKNPSNYVWFECLDRMGTCGYEFCCHT